MGIRMGEQTPTPGAGVSRIVRETWDFLLSETLNRSRRDIRIVLRFSDEYLGSITLRSTRKSIAGEIVEFTMECNTHEGGYGEVCTDIALDLASKLLQDREGVSVKRTVEIVEF
jgi:hypothetical protein